MANILITGGLGFIGSNLAHALVEQSHTVTIIDSLIKGLGGNPHNVEAIKDKITLFKEDIRDKEAITKAVQNKDIIFHCAGQVDHHRSIEHPFEDVDIRINGTLSLLEACKKQKPKVIFTSTRAVYGESKIPVNENAPTNPKGMYAITSLAAEKIVLMYNHLYNIPATVLRLTNTYGPRHQMTAGYGVVNYFLKLALDNKPITVMGDGKTQRDILCVDDCIKAMITVAESLLQSGRSTGESTDKSTDKSACNGKVFNLASGNGISFQKLAEHISNLTGCKIKKIDYPNEAKQIEPGDFVADVTKLQAAINFKPETSLTEGLKKTIGFYKKNKALYW